MTTKPIVCIIPGHSRTSPGATDVEGFTEYSRFADLLHWYFQGRYFREVGGVELHRLERPAFGSGTRSPLALLAEAINGKKPHLWVELHFDIAAAPVRDPADATKITGYAVDKNRRGSRGLYWPTSATGRRVAEVAGAAWADALGIHRLPPEKRRDLYLLAHTKSPGCLVETHFGSNENDVGCYIARKQSAMMSMMDGLIRIAVDLAEDGRLDLDPARATDDDGRLVALPAEVA